MGLVIFSGFVLKSALISNLEILCVATATRVYAANSYSPLRCKTAKDGAILSVIEIVNEFDPSISPNSKNQIGGIKYPKGTPFTLKERLNTSIQAPIMRLTTKILVTSFAKLSEISLPASFEAMFVSRITPSGSK